MHSHRPHFSRLLIIVLACGLLALAASLAAAQSSTRPLSAEEYHIESDWKARRLPFSVAAEDTPTGLWIPTTSINAPLQARDAAAVWTGTDMIVWGGMEWYKPQPTGGSRYTPATDSWHTISTVNAPPIRSGHAALWTGKEMIIWGGNQPGGRYNPTTDTWQSISTVNSPSYGGKIVWTGKEMLVWQGSGVGARYDPSLNAWQAITTTGAPNSSASFAVWIGHEMLVPGGRYNPGTDTWQPASLGDSSPCKFQVVAWTGKEVLTYGGFPYGTSSGCRYLHDSDTVLSLPAYPDTGTYVAISHGVWTGAELIVMGIDFSYYNSGIGVYRYNPATNTWTTAPFMSCTNGVYTPAIGNIVWTGSELVVWGSGGSQWNICGDSGPSYGLRYRPLRRAKSFSADMDTYIASIREWNGFGSEPLLWAGIEPGGYGVERILARFPVNLPAQSIVESGQLFLYQYAYTNPPTPMSSSLHRVTKPWTEATSWREFANSYDGTPASTAIIGTQFGWYAFNVTSVIDQWNKGAPNYGILLAGEDSGSRNEHVFYAREYQPPLLGVMYLDPLAEPSYIPDAVAPIATLSSNLPPLSVTAPLRLSWSGTDQGSGIHNFDVQVRDNGGAWQNWYTWAVGKSAHFSGAGGHTYCFRVRARDYASNVGNWSTESRCTTFYAHTVTGQVVDHRHTPVANADLQVSPAPLTMTVSALNGQYTLYFIDDQPRQITATQPAYAAPPAANISITATEQYDFVMQPTDNVILNSNIESGLAHWTVSGTLPISTTGFRHSGNLALKLNSDFTSTPGSARIEQALAIPATDAPQVLSFMYSLTATAPLSHSQLAVTLATTNTQSTIWNRQSICAQWCHAWIDVSAWGGRSITLAITLDQQSGETLQATVDEVVLGSWQTPIIDQVTPARIDAHAAAVITLTGQNFLAEPLSASYITGPLVLLNTTPLKTQWINTMTLTATVPATMPFGLYTVWVANPGGFRGAFPANFRVGHGIMLPLIAKSQ